MTIRREEMLRVAALAELGVAEEDAERLARDIAAIVEYVSLLEGLPVEEGVRPFVPGPAQVRLREDVVAPIPLAHPPADMAPEFVGGLYVVPRLGAMEGE